MIADKKLQIAVKTFCSIARDWGLDDSECARILNQNDADFLSLKSTKAPISNEVVFRISCVFSIYHALQILIPDHKASDRWVKLHNNAALFEGQSALDKMMTGNISDLSGVVDYLVGQIGYVDAET